jgi:hypothetical protein
MASVEPPTVLTWRSPRRHEAVADDYKEAVEWAALAHLDSDCFGALLLAATASHVHCLLFAHQALADETAKDALALAAAELLAGPFGGTPAWAVAEPCWFDVDAADAKPAGIHLGVNHPDGSHEATFHAIAVRDFDGVLRSLGEWVEVGE